MDDDDVGVEIEKFEAQGVDPITRLAEYVTPHKLKTKIPNRRQACDSTSGATKASG